MRKKLGDDGGHATATEVDGPPLGQSSLPPPSDIAVRVPSWRVPSEERASAVHLVGPTWSETAAMSGRLATELASVADRSTAAATIVRCMAALLPERSIAVRLGTGGDAVVASSKPLARGESLAAAVDIARAARARHEAFGPCAHAFGEETDGYSVALVDGAEVIGAVAIESSSGATTLSEACAAVLVLGPAGGAIAARFGRSSVVRAQIAWLVEHAPFPAALAGPTLEIEAVNALCAEALGQPVDALVGRDARSLITGPRSAEAVARVAAGEILTGYERETGSADGPPVVWVVVPFRDEAGRFAGAVAFGDDKSAVQALEQQILHAEKLATVGQLAAGIVHELNNPLTSISVYADYLLQKAERAGAEHADVERLRRIVDASARMLRFTRDLVSYARPSNEEPTEIDVGMVIDQSIGFVEHVLSSAGVRVVVDVAPGPPVRAVRGQLHQVFVNLLTNATQAISHSGRSSGAIRITATRDGAHVRVRLADDGPGIPGEHVARIFDPFFTTKEAGKGTGLGLSIVKNIVHLHGGTIEVESVHESEAAGPTGTTFIVSLPERRPS